MTGLEVFDTTIQKTNLWLKELMQVLDWEDRRKAYHALRAVLHALRDRLIAEEVAQLGAQLPMLIRGFYYEGWDPSRTPARVRHKEEFLAQIQEQFGVNDPINPEAVTHAVFSILADRVSTGEIEDIVSLLPVELRELWPVSVRVI